MSRRRTHGLRGEQGYAAILVALFASIVLLPLAAISVDVSRWYLEIERVQSAADAASLAGVTFMPYDLPAARAAALASAAANGYPNGGNVTVTVAVGTKPTQLRVTVRSRIADSFARSFTDGFTTVSRSAVADYQGPTPMGSPCNTFGNEPSAGAGASSPTPTNTARGASPFSNCATSDPQFWATIEGPQTVKEQGDRYQTLSCGAGFDGCSNGTNSEYDPRGYFFLVKVQPAAVNHPITLQLYDPAFVFTNNNCSDLPAASYFVNDMNPYVTTDGQARYSDAGTSSSTGAPFCNGDFFPGGGSTQMTTSFAVREQNDALDPMQGAVISGCVKQYTGRTADPDGNNNTTVSTAFANTLLSTHATYNSQMAAVFHNWATLCTFTPTRAGDYYLQVRSNVSTAGGSAAPNTNSNAAIIFSGNPAATAAAGNITTGAGTNSFGIRAVTEVGLEQAVSVSGYDRMPIYANATSASSTFNLVKVVPAAAGRFIEFSFFDAADISGGNGGTVRVFPPADATGTFTGTCTAIGGNAGSTRVNLTNCSAPVNSAANNGKVEKMSIPIPSNYNCNGASPGGCWYQVTISFPGATVTDVTTWNATVVGDPVRLIE